MENPEMTKPEVKNWFIEVKEDKFTKLKSVSTIFEKQWSGSETLHNRFMITDKAYTHSLKLNMDYLEKDNARQVFFNFTYTNSDDGFPNMHILRLYLILDDGRSLELGNVVNTNTASTTTKIGDSYTNIYVESAQLMVPCDDFAEIAKSNTIEYSLRFGGGQLEGTFSNDEVTMIKGFYNNVFDDQFELERLQKFITEIESSFQSEQASAKSIASEKLRKLIITLFVILVGAGSFWYFQTSENADSTAAQYYEPAAQAESTPSEPEINTPGSADDSAPSSTDYTSPASTSFDQVYASEILSEISRMMVAEDLSAIPSIYATTITEFHSLRDIDQSEIVRQCTNYWSKWQVVSDELIEISPDPSLGSDTQPTPFRYKRQLRLKKKGDESADSERLYELSGYVAFDGDGKIIRFVDEKTTRLSLD